MSSIKGKSTRRYATLLVVACAFMLAFAVPAFADEQVPAQKADGATTLSAAAEKDAAKDKATTTEKKDADKATADKKDTTDSDSMDQESLLLGSTLASAATNPPALSGSAHVQNKGDVSGKLDGSVLTIGSTGEGLRLEAISIKTTDPNVVVEYKSHIQNKGWEKEWSSNISGTKGQSLRLEAIKIRLSGDSADLFDIYYRAHVENVGWMNWAKNGSEVGSAARSLRMEALQITIVSSGHLAPTPKPKNDTDKAYIYPTLSTSTHVQDLGWQDAVDDNEIAGTSGQSKRLEAIKIQVNTAKLGTKGNIEYRTHVQNVGWQAWKANGELSGTEGQSLRLEALQIKLSGDLAKKYDVYYRVHAQNYGWLDWAHNGDPAGTAGESLRLEALQIKLVGKDEQAPIPNVKPYVDGGSIMGDSLTTANKMADYYVSKKGSSAYPSLTYESKLAPTIKDFCQILYDEAKGEGVRAEVLFAQAMLETGWLQFGGDVSASQCNFGGLGATGGGVKGATFENVQIGLRAQAQHLKAYACKDSLNNACVDPRFDLVERGVAPSIGDLGGKWAVPGVTYGSDIKGIMDELLRG